MTTRASLASRHAIEADAEIRAAAEAFAAARREASDLAATRGRLAERCAGHGVFPDGDAAFAAIFGDATPTTPVPADPAAERAESERLDDLARAAHARALAAEGELRALLGARLAAGGRMTVAGRTWWVEAGRLRDCDPIG